MNTFYKYNNQICLTFSTCTYAMHIIYAHMLYTICYAPTYIHMHIHANYTFISLTSMMIVHAHKRRMLSGFSYWNIYRIVSSSNGCRLIWRENDVLFIKIYLSSDDRNRYQVCFSERYTFFQSTMLC